MFENHNCLLHQHLPISNHVLRDLQCLHPLARKEATVRWLYSQTHLVSHRCMSHSA